MRRDQDQMDAIREACNKFMVHRTVFQFQEDVQEDLWCTCCALGQDLFPNPSCCPRPVHPPKHPNPLETQELSCVEEATGPPGGIKIGHTVWCKSASGFACWIRPWALQKKKLNSRADIVSALLMRDVFASGD